MVVPALWQASGRATGSSSSSIAAAGAERGLPVQPVLLSQMPAPMQLLVALLHVVLPAAVCFVSELHVRRSFAAHMQQQRQQEWAAARLTQEQRAAPQYWNVAAGQLRAGGAGAAAGAAPCGASGRGQELRSAGTQLKVGPSRSSIDPPPAPAISSDVSAGGGAGSSSASGILVGLDSGHRMTARPTGPRASSYGGPGAASCSSSSSSATGGYDGKAWAGALSPTTVCNMVPSESEPNSEADVLLLVCQQQKQQKQQCAGAAEAPAAKRVLTAHLTARAVAAVGPSSPASVARAQPRRPRKAPLPAYQGLTSMCHISVKVRSLDSRMVCGACGMRSYLTCSIRVPVYL